MRITIETKTVSNVVQKTLKSTTAFAVSLLIAFVAIFISESFLYAAPNVSSLKNQMESNSSSAHVIYDKLTYVLYNDSTRHFEGHWTHRFLFWRLTFYSFQHTPQITSMLYFPKTPTNKTLIDSISITGISVLSDPSKIRSIYNRYVGRCGYSENSEITLFRQRPDTTDYQKEVDRITYQLVLANGIKDTAQVESAILATIPNSVVFDPTEFRDSVFLCREKQIHLAKYTAGDWLPKKYLIISGWILSFAIAALYFPFSGIFNMVKLSDEPTKKEG
jgi:hypothetical protein